MMLLHTSSRKAPRYGVEVPCQVVRERDFRLLGVRAVDISAEGMLVATREPIAVGEKVIATFRVPRTGRWIDAEGVVVRIDHRKRRGEPGPWLALRFETIDEEEQRLLRVALRGLPPPLPSLPVRVDYAATVQLLALS